LPAGGHYRSRIVLRNLPFGAPRPGILSARTGLQIYNDYRRRIDSILSIVNYVDHANGPRRNRTTDCCHRRNAPKNPPEIQYELRWNSLKSLTKQNETCGLGYFSVCSSCFYIWRQAKHSATVTRNSAYYNACVSCPCRLCEKTGNQESTLKAHKINF